MTDLTQLLERLEKADGPNLNLERDIAVIIEGATPSGAISITWDGKRAVVAPNYTASLDEAVALAKRIGPEWYGMVSFGGKSNRCDLVRNIGIRETPIRSKHRVSTLAILIVLVKALIAEEQK